MTMSRAGKKDEGRGREIHQTLIGNITTCLCNKVHTSSKPESVTSAVAFNKEIPGQWRLAICRIPSGPQVVEIFPRRRKTRYLNNLSQGNILQMSPFYFLAAIVEMILCLLQLPSLTPTAWGKFCSKHPSSCQI